MAGTYLLIRIHPDSEKYPRFADEVGKLVVYLPITTSFEEKIRVVSEQVKENNLISASISGKDSLLLFELRENNYPERKLHNNKISQFKPYEAVITVSKNHFTLTVTYDKYAAPILSEEIRFSELKQAKENTDKLSMTFTSEWSDGSIIESACRVDMLSGCIDIEPSELLPDDSADLLRSYVRDESDNEYDVFAYEDNGNVLDWFVNTLDFIELQDSQSFLETTFGGMNMD